MFTAGASTVIWHPDKSVVCDGVVIGENCVIHAPVWIGKDVRIGNRVKIQAFTFIPEGVTIADDVFIGPHVVFTNDRKLEIAGKWQRTIVAKGAKIGANASILSGVCIGSGAVVGMGAVVLRDVEPGSTVVGNPARKI